jgi:hypothetical protein
MSLIVIGSSQWGQSAPTSTRAQGLLQL